MNRYKYRGLACNIADDEDIWCVSGVDEMGGSGILEWCYNEDDAVYMMGKMKEYPQFSELLASKFIDE